MTYTPILYPDLLGGMILNFTYSSEPRKVEEHLYRFLNMQIGSPNHLWFPTVPGICGCQHAGSPWRIPLGGCRGHPCGTSGQVLKLTLSSVSELELQKPPQSTYSSAAGANPAAEQQATRKVGASSYSHSFGGFSFSLNAARRMVAERRQKTISS